MFKVFDCLIDLPKIKPEYTSKIDNIFSLSKAENIYELHDYLDDDVYLFNQLFEKGLVKSEDNSLFLEVRKFLLDQCELIEYILDQEVFTVDLDNEDIFKECAKDACNSGAFELYLLKAIHSNDLEWALKEFEKDVLNDPCNAMTFKGACKKALELK